MRLAFQPYRAGDKPYLWTTYVEAMKPHISRMWGWDAAWQENDFAKGLRRYETLVLEDSDCRLGYLQVRNNRDSTFIAMIILEPGCRSRGYGPTVLDKLQNERPGKPLTLRCFRVNTAAYQFYIRCGFRVVRTDDYFIAMHRPA
ncbi:GNAT family N-acetyltransferase [Spectribacter hydrogenoxidans]|uniref:GNAT family N-acetyltransferase n=1 Tax=Spectribacter hydrogenoxidans TaxID=3075608 RepID=A0ABU3BZQ0_9GAMM|nr:GNAT family N-acetyltransferase [Salinisphaera sp. W335]MDT0634765.1 GNAT family N-acetyltransferase [Salinisphaera sp. W335]